MKCGEIIERLELLSPLSFAESWDNVGLLAGRRNKEVNRICIALDATDDVIREAAQAEADMLLTHHPLVFSPLKRITEDDFIGRRLVRLLQEDISYYAMHTNFDVMGMADAAADEIGLRDRQVLSPTYEDEIAKEGIGRYGTLPRAMSLESCALLVKEVFELESVRVFGDGTKTVARAAICPGSGKSVIDQAVNAGAEVLITGDINHHEGLDAMARGLQIIDAGHYGLEKIFAPCLVEYIRREMPGLQIHLAREKSPFWML